MTKTVFARMLLATQILGAAHRFARPIAWIATFVCCSSLVSSVGCSSSDSGGSGGGGAAIVEYCADVCGKRMSAGCALDADPSACKSQCEASIPAATTCHDDLTAVHDCVMTKGWYVCSPEGVAQLAGCAAEVATALSCMSCNPRPEDTTQVGCLKLHCCAEMVAYLSAPDKVAYDACLTGCTTDFSACLAECEAKSPAAATAYDSYRNCGWTNECK